MTLKVLTIYYKHRRGGFCKRLKIQIEAFLNEGWQVHYIAVEAFPYQNENLIPHILPCPFQNHSGLWFWIWFFTLAPLYALALGIKHRFKLISSATPVYAWISGPVKWLRQTPMVTLLFTKPQFSTDCHEDYRSLNKLESFLERRGIRWSDRMIANSEACRQSWIRHYKIRPEKISLLPNNIDPMPFNKPEQRQNLIQEFNLDEKFFIITSSGIFEPHKNLEFLIGAFSHVNSEKAVLVLIGAGEQRSHLKKVAQALSIADRVIFAGWREDARKLVQGSDLFIFPSLVEGMSESLLEATTCQVPCLVSTIPENMEVISNPEQHFSPHQTDALIQKINRCIEDTSFYDALLHQTEADSRRFIFEWNDSWMEYVQDITRRKV